MNKQPFDIGWEYTEGGGMFAVAHAPWLPVNLPHDLSIHKARNQNHSTGSAGGYAWSGLVTYRKKFQIPEEWRGQNIQVEFEGVYMNAEVSINGQLVALHPYGYTSFIVDLTPHLKYGVENLLNVVVNNSAQPNSRWYSGTGIYRHVWLRTGGTPHIKPWGIFITTPVRGIDGLDGQRCHRTGWCCGWCRFALNDSGFQWHDPRSGRDTIARRRSRANTYGQRCQALVSR